MTDILELSSPAVTVDGQTLADQWLDALISLHVDRGLCVVGRSVLRFSDNGYQLAAGSKFALGSAVEITAKGGTTIFSGLVTGTALEQSAQSHPELVVTADDHACKLALGTQATTHLQSSYSTVLSKIAGNAGLSADVQGGSALQEPHEYLLQSSTDLAFLDEITRRSNCVWWVDQRKLVVRAAGAASGSVTVTLGADLREFSLRASGLRPTAVKVNGWDAKAQQDIVGQSSAGTATATSTFTSSYVGSEPASKLGQSQLMVGVGNPNNADEAGSLANSLNANAVADAVVARGTCLVNPAVLPLTSVEVADAGPASGTYAVSRVEHVYRSSGFVTRFTAGPNRPSGLVDTLGPAAADPGFAITSLHTAKVSNVQDPDSVGRVKVRYNGGPGEIESAWARVVSLGGGASRGTVFQPEVNDEVLVGFERGDSRHPVVIGGLYSAKVQMPADSKLLGPGNKIGYRRITSRLGHVVELADGEEPTEQHILLKLSNGTHLIRVGADKLDIETASGKPISVKSGSASFQIDAGGNITISGNRIAIKAESDITVEANTTLGLKGKAQLSAEGAVVAVKGSASTDVESSAILALKGAMVKIN